MGRPGLRALVLLYSVTLFLSATLLFVVQPMVGKMVLPLLGGTPAVWSTCMVFFQAVLLGGYAYAHATAGRLGVRRQALVHLLVLALPLVALPLGVDPGRLRGGETSPVLDVLLLLAVSVGLPFLVVSATAPLLQTWFAHTGHPAARDPYFLYAASNLGSMLALLGYPTLIEPKLRLTSDGGLSQTSLWSLGYLLLAALIVMCAVQSKGASTAPSEPPPEQDCAGKAGARTAILGQISVGSNAVSGRRRLSWVALAFVPSSLLLGATTYVTTDIAAVPLLWVPPLALYLLSFILAFGRWTAKRQRMVTAVTVPVVLVVIFLMVSGLRQRIWITVLCHLLLLLVVALACHGTLALDRPAPRHLTEFYLMISVGGVMGGLFNALVAPVAFNSLVEYPLAMVLACMLVRERRGVPEARKRALLLDPALALGIGAMSLALSWGFVDTSLGLASPIRELGFVSPWIAARLYPFEDALNKIMVYSPPLLTSFLLRHRPLGMGLALASVLVVAGFVDARTSDRIHQARSFFGVLEVRRPRHDESYTELLHGTTLHGRQSLDPVRRGEPLSYYHREGPIGQVFAALDRRRAPRHVAVIGLGAGTLAAYARPQDAMTFYEIDRLVRDIAFDDTYFTYLTDARAQGATLRVELGDARIRMEAVRRERADERYDLIVVDAFTSDAIPVHLLTREAVRLYLALLPPGGLLALHISNRYLDLEPVVANLAADAGLGGRLLQHDESPEIDGADRSTWVVLARSPEVLGTLARDERWTAATLGGNPRVGVWTDDFHNLLSVFKW